MASQKSRNGMTSQKSSNGVTSQSKPKIKLALIGDKAVGKTSLINRFAHGTFSEQYLYTKGGDMEKMELPHHNISVLLIDAAGHDYVRSLIKTLYRDVQGILVVYDITREKTFEDVKEWKKQIELVNDSHPIVYMVGNKRDLSTKRKVQVPEAEHRSQDLGLPYYETSAKTGHMVKETFQALISEVLQKQHRPVRDKDIVALGDNQNQRQQESCCT